MREDPKLPDSPLAALHEHAEDPDLTRWRRATGRTAILLVGAYALGEIVLPIWFHAQVTWAPISIEDAVMFAMLPATNLLLAIGVLLLPAARSRACCRGWTGTLPAGAALIAVGYASVFAFCSLDSFGEAYCATEVASAALLLAAAYASPRGRGRLYVGLSAVLAGSGAGMLLGEFGIHLHDVLEVALAAIACVVPMLGALVVVWLAVKGKPTDA